MKPSVVIQSDCGYASTTFAKFAGMIETIAPHTDVVETNLSFEKGDSLPMSAYLYTLVPFWRDGTIFVSLMNDERKVAIQLENNSILLGSDDGFSTMCIEHFGFKGARLLSTKQFQDDEFILARASASLVNGLSFEELGEELTLEELNLFHLPPVRIEEGLAEGVIAMLLKSFGNLTFNIATDDFERTNIKHGDTVKVTISKEGNTVYEDIMTYQPSFGYVEVGKPVVFNGSAGYMDIGLNLKSFINECLPELLENDPTQYNVRIERLG